MIGGISIQRQQVEEELEKHRLANLWTMPHSNSQRFLSAFFSGIKKTGKVPRKEPQNDSLILDKLLQLFTTWHISMCTHMYHSQRYRISSKAMVQT